MQSTRWMLAMTRWMNCAKMLSFVGWMRLRTQSCLHVVMMLSMSSTA